jgi:Ser/Thr protein kinase RdoA (MazF antagonist)
VISPADEIPAEVRIAYGIEDAAAERVSIGWINRTFTIPSRRIVLQRLHPIFRGEVNLDIDAITAHIAAKGLNTPRLVRTEDGRAWVDREGEIWRALSLLDGRTPDAMSPALAPSAGALAARFHAALTDLDHDFAFTRPGAHDTPAHLTKLEGLLAAHRDHPRAREIEPFAEALLEAGARLPDLRGLPPRIIHGDLKVTNILVGDDGTARALVDLDTVARGTIAVDVGDALRSWCNRADESAIDASFDLEIFSRAIRGYAEYARAFVTEDEIASIVPGAETLAIELASRFASDFFEDRYFGFDATRYASRMDHNFARTQAQLSLARSIGAQRARLEASVRAAFA